MNLRRPKILLVDDGDRYIEIAHTLLRDYDFITRCELSGPCESCAHRSGCRLTHAHNWSETKAALAFHADIDMVLLDVVFELPEEQLLMEPGGDLERSRRLQGIEILRALRIQDSKLPVILMTSKRELEFQSAADALEADEYVTLAETDAFDARAVSLLIERTFARSFGNEVEGLDYIWGQSRAMNQLKRDAVVWCPTSLPLLILGETGSGKSALAGQVVHPMSKRAGAFVVADLAAVPENLVAAQLFGTVTGAYSGAVDRAGWIEKADGGTLFLDEIGTLSSDIQRMLLVTLQNGRFTRLGATEEKKMDVKLLAGTNSDLSAAVRAGTFRSDLFARLNPAAALTLPPLRERMDDLPVLMAHFVKKLFREEANRKLMNEYRAVSRLTKSSLNISIAIEDAIDGIEGIVFVLNRRSYRMLVRHSFPGNIRELEFLIANLTLYSLSDAIGAVKCGRGGPAGAERTIFISEKLVRRLIQTSVLDTPGTIQPKKIGVKVNPAPSLREVSRDLETQVMMQLYRETGGDFALMASKLLSGNPTTNARRVRLRFNQLGLKAVALRRRGIKQSK